MMTRRGSGNPADEYLPMLRPLGSERSEPPLEDLRHPVLMVVRIDLRRFPSATWVGARPQRPARLLDPKILAVAVAHPARGPSLRRVMLSAPIIATTPSSDFRSALRHFTGCAYRLRCYRQPQGGKP